MLIPPHDRELALNEGVLHDVVADGLSVIFAGINPGLPSVAHGHNFATPGNRFWPALHRSGFTPRQLSPSDEAQLLPLGLGVTSIVRRPTARASEITVREFEEGGRDLRNRVAALRPQWLALLGVTGYRAAFAAPNAQIGRQPRLGETQVWVLPNPSGLNAHYPPAAQIPRRDRTAGPRGARVTRVSKIERCCRTTRMRSVGAMTRVVVRELPCPEDGGFRVSCFRAAWMVGSRAFQWARSSASPHIPSVRTA
jgi:TDG/mug DNA glycosylase family protein